MLDSETAPGGVIVYYADGDEEIIHVNQYVIDLFECDSFEDFMTHVHGSFQGFVHNEDVGSAEDSIWGQVEQQDSLDHIYYRIKTKSGRLVNIDDYGRLVETRGERPVFYVFIVEMKEWGSVDWLTGLPSMQRFCNLARLRADAMRDRGERPIAVALDITNFKTFNSENGRDRGDILLCDLADLMRKYFGNESCSRFAEDHFYAVTPAYEVEQRMNNLFADYKLLNDGKVPSLRAGLYECEDGEDISNTGIDRAKYACDSDKKTWLSHFIWFSDDMLLESGLHSYVLEHFEEAVDKRWLRPHYQAVVRSSTGHICGEEALARWMDPEMGTLMPDQFIPVLEEAGLLQDLDLHIIDCVLEDFVTKRSIGVPLVPVSVNISLRDLGKIDLASEIARRAQAVDVPLGLLRVEFAESAPSESPRAIERQIHALHEEGIEVWLDDFGSGYSSLATLEQFDFDLIKLDIELIRNIHSERTLGIVTGLIEAAGKLGMSTLAEGVETEEQDRILNNIGCDMMQGYHYSAVNTLEFVIDRFVDNTNLTRERTEELQYWNEVGLYNLNDPASYVDESSEDGEGTTEFPAGVIERRGNIWRLVRSNGPFKEFLYNRHVIDDPSLRFTLPVFESGSDADFRNAAERTLKSGKWERIAGQLEYGTGLQFYAKFITRSERADAFAVTSIPTMLGTALGTYGDVPVSYAVLKVVLDDAGKAVEDVEYVYANDDYCALLGLSRKKVFGMSFRNTVQNANAVWFPYCYRAVVYQEKVHDVIFAPEIGHWISLNMAPSPVEGCCTLAYTIADDERREREEMIVGLDTSARIIEIMSDFDREKNYNLAMNGALVAMSKVVHPDRLCIYERGEQVTRNTFEWCAPGIEPQIHTLQEMDNASIAYWDELALRDKVVAISDVEEIRAIDENAYYQLARQDIRRMLIVPLYAEGETIGYLGADNYVLQEGLDTRRLLEVAASSIGARIVNQKLLDQLEQTGTHDGLTHLLNRRGIDDAIDEVLDKEPNKTFVLALIDVDDFKVMNDLHGHAVGDEALRVLARTLTETFSSDSIIGRNGGDEFLVMLFGDDARNADDLFAQLSESELEFVLDNKRYRISTSIGYVEYPAQSSSLGDAYTKADEALYNVKLAGKFGHGRYTGEAGTDYRSLLGFSSRSLTESLPGGILVYKGDGSGEILYANEELVRMLGCTDLLDFMEFSGTYIENLVNPNQLPSVRNQLAHQKEFANVDAKLRLDFEMIDKAGNTVRAAANSRLIEMENVGKVYYLNIVEL